MDELIKKENGTNKTVKRKTPTKKSINTRGKYDIFKQLSQRAIIADMLGMGSSVLLTMSPPVSRSIASATARCNATAIRLDHRERNLRHKPFLKRAGNPRERSRANSTSKVVHGSCHLP